jgi:hypothetical protein
MAKKASQAIADGLEDAIAYSQGEKACGRAHKVKARDINVVAPRDQRAPLRSLGVAIPTRGCRRP